MSCGWARGLTRGSSRPPVGVATSLSAMSNLNVVDVAAERYDRRHRLGSSSGTVRAPGLCDERFLGHLLQRA